MQQTNGGSTDRDNVVDIFSGHAYEGQHPFLRLSPELDGLSLLYAGPLHEERYYSMKILCWGIRDNGEIDALVPWLGEVHCASELSSANLGSWEGFYNPCNREVFYQAPEHKKAELEYALRYFAPGVSKDGPPLQEFPDPLGTHALFTYEKADELTLQEITSWQLSHKGQVQAMVVDEQYVTETPVLPGDPCLYPAAQNPNFRLFFQHRAANQIKAKDPEAMAAVAILIEG
jgi:hypothetical protein